MKKTRKVISIITVNHIEETKTSSMFPSPEKLVNKYSEIAEEVLAENLAGLVQTLGDVIARLPEQCGSYDLSTLSFSLSIDGRGKVSLIGELSAGIASSMTICLTRRKRNG
jgi:hypothetical protein